MGSLHARTRAQSIIMQVSVGAILFQFASLQGPRICSLIILNEVVSQLESAFFKILLCLMILFVNFKYIFRIILSAGKGPTAVETVCGASAPCNASLMTQIFI